MSLVFRFHTICSNYRGLLTSVIMYYQNLLSYNCLLRFWFLFLVVSIIYFYLKNFHGSESLSFFQDPNASLSKLSIPLISFPYRPYSLDPIWLFYSIILLFWWVVHSPLQLLFTKLTKNWTTKRTLYHLNMSKIFFFLSHCLMVIVFMSITEAKAHGTNKHSLRNASNFHRLLVKIKLRAFVSSCEWPQCLSTCH